MSFHRIAMPLRILLTVALFPAAGCDDGEPPDREESELPVAPVAVRAVAVRRDVMRPSIELIGTLAEIPERTAVVCARTDGSVASVLVAEGGAVRADDPIVHLDPRPAEARLAKARGMVAESETALARLKKGPREQEVEAAREEARVAKASVDGLRRRVEALQPLLEKEEVSSVRYLTVVSSLTAAEATYGAARARLDLLEAGTRPELIREAEARLAVSRAELAAAELERAFCDMAAPIDGVVTELPVRLDQFVSQGTKIAMIMDLSTLFVRIRIPGAYLARVGAGAPVEVRVAPFAGRVFSGEIARMAGTADSRAGELTAFASIANEGGELRPGLACRVTVRLPAVPDALLVPVAAISDRGGSPVVTVVRDGKAHELEVKLGVQTSDEVQILEGLAPDDVVATEGGYGLPDGCPVRIVPETDRTERDL